MLEQTPSVAATQMRIEERIVQKLAFWTTPCPLKLSDGYLTSFVPMTVQL